MNLKKVNIKKGVKQTSLPQQFVAAARFEPERSMSNGRLTGSILSLFLAFCVIYASFFYVPAYFSVSQILGFSNESEKLPVIDPSTEGQSAIAAYARPFKLRRGFIRRGQALKVDYSLSPGTIMTVDIQRCAAPVFVEVIFCNTREGQTIKIEDRGPGAKSIVMRNAGFYYFDESVTNLDGSPTKKPYRVLWSRKTMRPAP